MSRQNVLGIKVYGASVLRQKSANVKKMDKDILTLIDAMALIMYENKGIGLAAPQIGVAKRVIVADTGEGRGLTVLINPKIVWSEGSETKQEGCLSFPGIYLDIKRPKKVIVEGLDRRGGRVRMDADGLLARVLQHEIDHVDGVLMVDRVGKKALKGIKKELENLKKSSSAR